ncbi:glucosamine-6-phosphate deaminase [Gleimia hominis]|uniref:glucosamine-6-phosphate deaminase n=1 Tax=Gleimia hominis TaxID=595468 RepID=UPI000C808277|nr:glucosamine-6-phosphate deaminase [Gleimia hominis]WIK65071.1 glucosamine-6-phosphate deaminase [Gleimia hominis]
MRIGIFPTAPQASKVAADMVLELYRENPDATLGVATGSTPEYLYDYLRQAHAAGTLSLERAKAFALDEYVGLPDDHPQTYRNVLRRELVGNDKTGLREDYLFTPGLAAPADDPTVTADQYDAAIEATGVDLQILGLGADGHIGFNEPGDSLVSRTHAEVLAPDTIRDNARFFNGDETAVPKKCITQGLGTIMDAKALVLLAFGKQKAEAVHQLIEGPVSARWPVTILQTHPEVTVLLDDAAASNLELTDFYKRRWELA